MTTLSFLSLNASAKDETYSVQIKATIALELTGTGEIRQRELYFGDIPLMTDRGTFIINGAERVCR